MDGVASALTNMHGRYFPRAYGRLVSHHRVRPTIGISHGGIGGCALRPHHHIYIPASIKKRSVTDEKVRLVIRKLLWIILHALEIKPNLWPIFFGKWRGIRDRTSVIKSNRRPSFDTGSRVCHLLVRCLCFFYKV